MAGGWIQAGLLASLADKGGLPAWKWIFIIVSVMTIPVALFGTLSSPFIRRWKYSSIPQVGYSFRIFLPIVQRGS